MLATPHLLIGATIATRIHPLPLALLLAFLSHYILDAIPHWDYSINKIKTKKWKESFLDFLKVILDSLLGIILILLFAPNVVLALGGAFFALIPDGMTFLTVLLPETKLFQKHHFLHSNICHWFRKRKIPLFWLFVSQIIIIFVALYLL